MLTGILRKLTNGRLRPKVAKSQEHAPPPKASVPAPPAKPRVFVSYSRAEHVEYASQAVERLKNSGYSVWLDEANAVSPIRIEGLDFSLLNGIKDSDAMLYFTPSEEIGVVADMPVRIKKKQAIFRAFFNDSLHYLNLLPQNKSAHGFLGLVSFWYLKWIEYWYEVDLNKRFMESWQQWEARVARDCGLRVIRIIAVNDSANREDSEGVYLKRDHFLGEFDEKILPLLTGLRRGKSRLRMSKLKQEEYSIFVQGIKAIFVALIPFVIALELIDKVREWIANCWVFIKKTFLLCARFCRDSLRRLG